jgi:hypothetical protein
VHKGEVRLGMGLFRVWAIFTILWVIYCIYNYCSYCRFGETNMVCDFHPSRPAVAGQDSYVYITYLDSLMRINAVPALIFVLGALALRATLWIIQGFGTRGETE